MGEHGRKRREAEFSCRLVRYRVEYYEKIFPWIIDYVGDDVMTFPTTPVDLSGPEAEPTVADVVVDADRHVAFSVRSYAASASDL